MSATTENGFGRSDNSHHTPSFYTCAENGQFLCISSPKRNDSTSPESQQSGETHLEASKENHSKRKRKKKSREETFRSEALEFPPCCVCSGKSSGYHFGVTSCEACKNFFRRYLSTGKTFKCKVNNDCKLNEKGRPACPSCRLQRCLQVGMSKEKVKKGRLSSLDRTEIIHRVKMESAVDGEVIIVVDTETRNDQLPNTDDIDFECELITTLLSRQSIQNPVDQFSDDLIESLKEAKDSMVRLNEIDGNIRSDEEIKLQCQEYARHFQLKQDVFGNMASVSFETYETLYKQYNLDLDNRMEVIKRDMNDFEGCMDVYCNFPARIPGFRQLSFSDQSTMVKANMQAICPLFFAKYYCPETKVYVQKNQSFHMDEWRGKYYSDIYLDKFINLHCKVQEMGLSESELVLLGAIIVCQSTCPLQNPAAVERIQESLMALLLKEIRKVYQKKCYKRMTQILDLLYHLRDYSEIHMQEYKQLCESSIGSEFPILKQLVVS